MVGYAVDSKPPYGAAYIAVGYGFRLRSSSEIGNLIHPTGSEVGSPCLWRAIVRKLITALIPPAAGIVD
jgi:hypothetical protein